MDFVFVMVLFKFRLKFIWVWDGDYLWLFFILGFVWCWGVFGLKYGEYGGKERGGWVGWYYFKVRREEVGFGYIYIL